MVESVLYSNIMVYLHFDPEDTDCLYIGEGSGGRPWDPGSETWREGERTVNRRSPGHYDHLMGLLGRGWIPSQWVLILASGLTRPVAKQLEQRLRVRMRPRFNLPPGVKPALCPAEADLLFRLRAQGKTHKKIAEELGVHSMTVYRALTGRTQIYV